MLLALRECRVKIGASASQRIMAGAVHHDTVCVGNTACLLNIIPNKRRVMNVVLDENRAIVDVPVTA